MKICEINLFHEVLGGAETYIRLTGRHLTEQGHEVFYVFACRDAGDEPFLPGSREYFLPWLSSDIPGAAAGRSHTQEVRAEREKLRRILAEERPDVVHIDNLRHPLFLDDVRVPVVRTVHDYRFLCPKLTKLLPRDRALCRRNMGAWCFLSGCLSVNVHELGRCTLLCLERELYKGAAGVIVKSRHMQEELIRNGFDPERVRVAPLAQELPERTSRLAGGKILCVGRLSEEKGLDVLLDALRLVEADFRLTVAGDGPERERLEKLAERPWLRGRVDFLGWRGPAELEELYLEHRVLALPSMWPEPGGLVGLEALAHGAPVVAFDVGGVADWMEHERTGFLVPRGDEKALARGLETLLKDRELARRMGEQGRSRVALKFGPEENARRLAEILEEFAGKAPRRRAAAGVYRDALRDGYLFSLREKRTPLRAFALGRERIEIDLEDNVFLAASRGLYPCEKWADGTAVAWSKGEETLIRLELPPLGEEGAPPPIEVDLFWKAVTAPPEKEREVEILLNDHLAERVRLGEKWTRSKIVLAPPALAAGENLLLFRYGEPVRPASFDPTLRDRRSLAVAFTGIAFQPRTALALEEDPARLDLAEDSVFSACRGFYPAEKWEDGRTVAWSEGPESVIPFSVPAWSLEGQEALVSLTWKGIPPPGEKERRVEALLNDRPVGELRSGGEWGRSSLVLAPPALRDGYNVLVLRYGETVCPARLDPAAGDARELAAAFSEILFQPRRALSIGSEAARLDLLDETLMSACGGFYPGEEWPDGLTVAWSRGEESTIPFSFKPPPRKGGGLRLRLGLLWKAAPTPPAEERTVEVILNGTPVEKTTLDEKWKRTEILLAPPLLREGRNLLAFRYSEPYRPEGQDGRALAAAFAEVAFRPQASLIAGLEPTQLDLEDAGLVNPNCGFHPPEETPGGGLAAWSRGGRTELPFDLSAETPGSEPVPLRADVRWKALLAPGEEGRLADVLLNGRHAARFTVGGEWTDAEFVLAPPDLRRGPNLLAFVYGKTLRPVEIDPASGDDRELAVAFAGLTLRPLAAFDLRDGPGRLDLLDPLVVSEANGFHPGERWPDGRAVAWSRGLVAAVPFMAHTTRRGGRANRLEAEIVWKGAPTPPAGERRAEARLNGEPVGTIAAGPEWRTSRLVLAPPALREGYNVLSFHFDGTVRPRDLDPECEDARELAVAFAGLTLRPLAD